MGLFAAGAEARIWSFLSATLWVVGGGGGGSSGSCEDGFTEEVGQEEPEVRGWVSCGIGIGGSRSLPGGVVSSTEHVIA